MSLSRSVRYQSESLSMLIRYQMVSGTSAFCMQVLSFEDQGSGYTSIKRVIDRDVVLMPTIMPTSQQPALKYTYDTVLASLNLNSKTVSSCYP